MSGIRLYSMYLNNVTKYIDDYTVLKNLKSSSISVNDIMSVALEVDNISYVSDILEMEGKSSLYRGMGFLKEDVKIYANSDILSEVGIDDISKDVLKYCGNLLENGTNINPKSLGKAFLDISNGTMSINSLSKELLSNVSADSDDEDDDYDDDDYEDYDDSYNNIGAKDSKSSRILNREYDIDDEIENNKHTLDYNDIRSKSDKKDSKFLDEDGGNLNNQYSDYDFSTDLDESVDDIDTSYNIDYENTENDSVSTDIALNYNSNGNINDKLASAISIAGSKIVKTPKKVKSKSKAVYNNVIDFE